MERLPWGSLTCSFAARPEAICRPPGARGPRCRFADAAGFSLVEVLVAVMVLSIGLLGLAALQIAGARANDGTRLRTTATLAAYDVADRLRAGPASFFPLGQASSGTVAIESDGCEGVETETTDAIIRWQRDFCALALPPPSSGDFARVDCRVSNECGGGNCAIVVRWDGRRGDRRSSEDSETTESSVRELRFCTRIATAI